MGIKPGTAEEETCTSYAKYHQDCIEEYEKSDALMANWFVGNFSALVLDGKSVLRDSKDTAGEMDAGKVQAADKDVLQNYGRPYENGRPTGTYYSHAKQPGSV